MILVPAMDMMPTVTFMSFMGLDKPESAKTVSIIGTLVYDARNSLAEEAIKAEADLALWIDSDMAFEPDFYRKLKAAMDESGADMVSAMCWRRKPPIELVQFEVLQRDEEHDAWNVRALSKPPEGIQEIDACGFGGVLMKVDLLRDMKQVFGVPFQPTDGLGEDLAFCARAKMLGAKIVCDGRVLMGHIGTAVYGGKPRPQQGEKPEGNT